MSGFRPAVAAARLLMAVALLQAPVLPLGAQGGARAGTWEDLRRDLSQNQALRVELARRGGRLGRAVAIDDSTLAIQVHSEGPVTTFRRDEIRRVRIKTGSKTVPGTLIGAGIGGGVVAGAVLISGEGLFSGSDPCCVGGLLALTAAFSGALIGALVGNEVATYDDYGGP